MEVRDPPMTQGSCLRWASITACAQPEQDRGRPQIGADVVPAQPAIVLHWTRLCAID